MNKETKARQLKLLTDIHQTNELLRVGYPYPEKQRSQPGVPAYSIGQLIDFAKQCAEDIIITYNRSGWLVGVYGTHAANFEEDELIDCLFKFCMWIKLNAYFEKY